MEGSGRCLNELGFYPWRFLEALMKTTRVLVPVETWTGYLVSTSL